MRIVTIGYGGRNPSDFQELLKQHNVTTLVDVRLRPDRASMGSYVKAKSPDKGIQKLLEHINVDYVSLIELGNVFLDHTDWRERYRKLLCKAGDILTERLLQQIEEEKEKKEERTICLMCSEKSFRDCHRQQLADYLTRIGYPIEHIQ